MSSVTLMLLPGLDGTGIMFEPLLRDLPRDWRPIVVRYPGDQGLSYDELLPLARSMLPTEGQFFVLGESFSGPLAIRLAAERPSGLRGLILCATFAKSSKPELPRWCGSLVQPWSVGPLRYAGQIGARLLGFSSVELRRLFARAQREVDTRVLVARVRETLKVDVTRELKQVAVPMLYLAAHRDQVVSRACLRTIQGHRPDIVVETFDSPHWVMQMQPRMVVDALRSFIERCESNAPHT